MDSEEYFERVIRFLETKGWNTSTTQVNETIYLVTGTRKSETYYDRMMTIVGIDQEMAFGERHLNYLVDAASDHDVDQLLATCRDGVESEADGLLEQYGIEFIDPETVDDAFIDEFRVEREDGLFTHRGDGLSRARFTRSAGPLLALYLLSAAVFGVAIGTLGVLSGPGDPLPDLLAGALVLVGPLIAIVGTLALVAGERSTPPSALGVALGSVVGFVLFVLLVGGSGGAVDIVASTELFGSTAAVLALFGLSVPTAIAAVAVAYSYVSLRSVPEP